MERNLYARTGFGTYAYIEMSIKKHRICSGMSKTRRNKAKQFGLGNCNNFIIML